MRRILLIALASTCLLTCTSFAGEAPTELPTAVTAGSAQPAPTEAQIEAARIERLQRVELNARMQVVIDASNKTLAGLQTMIDATTDPATLKNLEGRMAQAKRGTRIDLLRVQATFAREYGRIAQADAIDAEIAEVLNPTRRPTAATRTASTRRPSEVVTTDGAR